MSADSQPPSGSKSEKSLPEIKLKKGFKSPIASEASDAPRSSGALSIDEMLAITSRRKAEGGATSSSSQVSAPQPHANPTATAGSVSPPSEQTLNPQTTAPPSMRDIDPQMSPPPSGQSFGAEAPLPQTAASLNPDVFARPVQRTAPPSAPSPLEMLQERPKIAIGAAVAVVLLLAALVGFGVLSLLKPPVKFLIESKPTSADVYLGEENLGKTPLKIELTDLDEMPVLKLEGYEDTAVPQPEEIKEHRRNIIKVKLDATPFPLDWAGLPEGTRVWWNGAENQPKSAGAGFYNLKIKPKDQSSFQWKMEVPWKGGEAFAVGSAVASEIARRPVLKLTLTGAGKAEVIVKDGPRFTQVVSLGKSPEAITLPQPGKYAIKVKGTASHGSFDKSLEFKSGDKKSMAVNLAPAYRNPGSGYSAPRNYNPGRTYRPRPAAPRPYRSSGGGAGTIAPPAF